MMPDRVTMTPSSLYMDITRYCFVWQPLLQCLSCA